MGKYEIFDRERVLGEVEADFLPTEKTLIKYKGKIYFASDIIHHIESSDGKNLESKVRVNVRKI
jgi:hypothetical protein